MAAKKNSSKKSRQARRRRVDLVLQPTITTELQILYNIWRDLEEKGKAAKKGQRNRKAENAARLAFKRRVGACVHCKKRKTNVSSGSGSTYFELYAVSMFVSTDTDAVHSLGAGQARGLVSAEGHT